MSAGSGGDLHGTVGAYDDVVGMGTVVAASGGGRELDAYPFHCTQIADGSRTIEVGTDVIFRLVPGRLGRWEAGALRKGT